MSAVAGDEDYDAGAAPILAGKEHWAVSVFSPENLLREARRQKGLPEGVIPRVCVLDPDGDIVRYLKAHGRAALDPAWACYHTELIRTSLGGVDVGVVGCAVGAPFAVLVAEQMFVSGCELLISITSAGQLVETRPPPYFLLIEEALRDEGTSYHYQPPALTSVADPALLQRLQPALAGLKVAVARGATWTTDAPYRETAARIAALKERGFEAVEMEAAALYAFAAARAKPVVCFAHITNRMAQAGNDFEKGEAGGAIDALTLIEAVAKAAR